MAEKPSKWKVFTAGIIRENPVLRLVLGCCSALAVTTTVSGAVGMGLSMTFVLVCSNIVISALRKVIPGKVHLPCYIVIIATFGYVIINLVVDLLYPVIDVRLRTKRSTASARSGLRSHDESTRRALTATAASVGVDLDWTDESKEKNA